jgi:hypothetical protein
LIVFDLVCSAGHVFEAWFGSSADFADQQARGLLTCPVCDSAQVTKAVMAPAIPARANRGGGRVPLARLRQEIASRCDDVGDRFADEARIRHARSQMGETIRGVYGEATAEAVRALLEDGIPVAPLPVGLRRNWDA